MNICKEMKSGEILNSHKTQTPLLQALLYGDKVLTAKLSKRLSCAIKHLDLRVQFEYQHNTEKAINAGIKKDPTLVLNGNIFLEGLPQAESITEAFEKLLKKRKKMSEHHHHHAVKISID